MKFGTKSILVKDGKILLIKRSNYNNYLAGKWDIPGGRIEAGERLFEGHHREIMEETKLKIEIIEPVKNWLVERDGEKHVGITFLSKHKEGNVILSNEHTEFKWLTFEELQNLNAPNWIKDEAKLAKEINPELFNSRQDL